MNHPTPASRQWAVEQARAATNATPTTLALRPTTKRPATAPARVDVMHVRVHPDHVQGLANAYSHHPPVWADNGTLYIAGTRIGTRDFPKDVLDDGRMLINVYNTRRYAQAVRAMQDAARAGHPIKTVVGHSLGASVAGSIAHDHNLEKVLYAHPVIQGPGSSNEIGGVGDPLTMLNFSSNNRLAGLNPHDFHNLAASKRFKRTARPNKREASWAPLPRAHRARPVPRHTT